MKMTVVEKKNNVTGPLSNSLGNKAVADIGLTNFLKALVIASLASVEEFC